MSQHYSDPSRASDPCALPDIEVFELTAHEVVQLDEDSVLEYAKRHEFRLCHMSRRIYEAMLDTIVEEQGISGGWFYWYCFPGCLPDSSPIGPYDTKEAALMAAREENA